MNAQLNLKLLPANTDAYYDHKTKKVHVLIAKATVTNRDFNWNDFKFHIDTFLDTNVSAEYRNSVFLHMYTSTDDEELFYTTLQLRHQREETPKETKSRLAKAEKIKLEFEERERAELQRLLFKYKE